MFKLSKFLSGFLNRDVIESVFIFSIFIFTGVELLVYIVDFTGDVCEVKIDSSSIYSEILSGQFPFESYKKSLAAESQQDDLKYF